MAAESCACGRDGLDVRPLHSRTRDGTTALVRGLFRRGVGDVNAEKSGDHAGCGARQASAVAGARAAVRGGLAGGKEQTGTEDEKTACHVHEVDRIEFRLYSRNGRRRVS